LRNKIIVGHVKNVNKWFSWREENYGWI